MSYTVLIIDDDEKARKNIGKYLLEKGYEIIEGSTIKEAKESIENCSSDIIILDAQLPDGYGPNLLAETINLPTRPPIIMATGYGDIEMAVDAMRNGAHDFLTKPISDMDRLDASLKRAEEIVKMRRELLLLRKTQSQIDGFVIGNNPLIKDVLNQAQKAAKASVSVLITGDTGTGKEVFAKFIHSSGPRANKVFLAENCAAIQPTMIEAELFGFEAHAFTGADKRKIGLMEIADEGILFLDEISSLSLDVQAKLLRALEEQSFRRVGGITQIHVDVQILAASNRDLKALIHENKFREDLYFRLKVVDLHLPTLKERKEDIPELVGFFIRKFNPKMGLNVLDITPNALKALMNYDWSGNIRELSHSIESAMIFCNGEIIDLPDLPKDIKNLQ